MTMTETMRGVLADKLLTAREREVLERVALGWSNARIGEDLFLSELTVKTHMRRITAKLGTNDRAHAVAEGVRTGQVTLRLVQTSPGGAVEQGPARGGGAMLALPAALVDELFAVAAGVATGQPLRVLKPMAKRALHDARAHVRDPHAGFRDAL